MAGAYFLGDRENLRSALHLPGERLQQPLRHRHLRPVWPAGSQLGNGFTLITGLRLERRLTDYRDNNGVDSDPDKDLWGGRIALEYQFDDNRMGYGEVSRGYRANGVNAAILASMETSDDPGYPRPAAGHCSNSTRSTWSTTSLASRARLLADTLQARLALFYMDRDDQQVKGSLVIPRPDGSTAFIDYTSNAAQGNNYGLELEAQLACQRKAASCLPISACCIPSLRATSTPMATTCRVATRPRRRTTSTRWAGTTTSAPAFTCAWMWRAATALISPIATT